MRYALVLLVDIAIALLLTVILFITVTAGGTYELAGFRVSLRSVGNPLTFALFLVTLRLGLRWRLPFLGLRLARWDVFSRWANDLLDRMSSRPVPPRVASITVVGTCFAVTCVKVWFAWAHPGFFSGDDVEIHEMSLGFLLGHDWPVWSLRNPLFPMLVVYPAQWLARTLGVSDGQVLVWAGRALVGLASTLTILISWKIAGKLFKDAEGFAVLATLLVATNKLQVAFGSTELPRPVISALIAAAFLAVLQRGQWSAVGAGALVGVAAAFRYSEFTFMAAGVLLLLLERSWMRAAGFAIASIAAAGTAIALADAVYWGAPFFSFYQALDYTVVHRLSSRGYQSPLWYSAHVAEWSTWFIFGLSILGSFHAPRALVVWTWTPLLILSALPHKEARYVLPTIPFVCLLAAYGLWACTRMLAQPRLTPKRATACGLLLLALGFSALHDAGSWRLRRSDSDVALFRSRVLPLLAPGDILAVEQLWRVGGHLYVPRGVTAIDLDPSRLEIDVKGRHDWIMLDARSASEAVLLYLSSAGCTPVNISDGSGYTVFQCEAGDT